MISEFENIIFPIIIKDRNDLDVIYKLKDFQMDPDLYFHEYDSHMELIDSNGQVYSWNYDYNNKTNIPGILKRKITLDELQEIVIYYFKASKNKRDLEKLVYDSNSIKEVITQVADKF